MPERSVKLMADVDPGMAGILDIVETLGATLATSIRLTREVMPQLAAAPTPLAQLLEIEAHGGAGAEDAVSVTAQLSAAGAALLADLTAARQHLAAAEAVLRPLAGLPARIDPPAMGAADG